MADFQTPPYGGLDPSLVGYVQNPDGGAPPPPPPQQFGIDPNVAGPPGGQELAQPSWPPPEVTSAVQNGFAPPVSLDLPNPYGAPPPPAWAPVSSPPSGLPAEVVNGVQSGFAPQPIPDVYAPTTAKGKPPPLANPESTAEHADAMQWNAVNMNDAADHAGNEAATQLNDANARIQANSNQRFNQQAAANQANEDQYQKDRQRLTTQRESEVADWAKYKVNTDRSIGTSGLIAVALSGIGDAIAHRNGPNAALQILDGAIDKRISDQWAQKGNLGKAVDMTDSQLTAIGATARDRREAEGLQRATLLQQQANDLKSAALESANPQQKARALALAAEREQQRAAIVGGVATRQASAVKDQREAQQQAFSNRIQSGHLGLAQDQFGFEKKKWQDQLDASKSAAVAAGDQAAAAQADVPVHGVESGSLRTRGGDRLRTIGMI